MAIKRWKYWLLTLECKQYSYGLALAILMRCYKEHSHEGYEQLVLKEYAFTWIPRSLGLTFEQIEELVNKKEEEILDELLNISSDKKMADDEKVRREGEKEESNEQEEKKEKSDEIMGA